MKHIYKLVLIIIIVFAAFACEKEVSSTSYDETNYDGRIFITSHPEGADIYLNGKISGKKTPDSLIWLSQEQHYITLKKFLYRDTTIVFSPENRKTINLDVNYYANPRMYGSIYCASVPSNAEIFIGDSATGKNTPAELKGFLPGTYDIILKYPNHLNNTQKVVVKSRNRTMLEAAMVDTTYWITYREYNSGLMEDDVTALAVDDNNLLWVGTATKGLATFDGTNWTYFTTDNSNLPSNEITTLEKDKSGKIWMGTMAGAAKYDNGSWTLYTSSNTELHDERITCIEFDSHNNVWFGTQNGIAVKRDTGWAIYNTENSNISGNFINKINTNVGGEIWAGTSKDGLSRYFGYWKPVRSFTWADGSGSPGNTISAFDAEVETGMAWVGWLPERNGAGRGGITTYSEGVWRFKNINLPSNYITCIYIDAENTKWIGTDAGLLRFVDLGDRVIFDETNSNLESSYIKTVVKDQLGFVWIATRDGGLTKYKREKY